MRRPSPALGRSATAKKKKDNKTLLLTATEFSFDATSPHSGTDKTNKNKYI